MIVNKIIGYVLLAAGLLIISGTLFYSYNIFTAKASAPLVFRTSAPQNQPAGSATNAQAQIQLQIEESVTKQLENALPPETFTKILNLLSWSIFAAILIWGGSAIAAVGVKMVR